MFYTTIRNFYESCQEEKITISRRKKLQLWREKSEVNKGDKPIEKFEPPHWSLVLVFILVISAILLPQSSDCKMVLLILSGTIVGYYYGFHNWRIFHKPFADEIYSKLPKTLTEKIIEKYGSGKEILEKTIEKTKEARIEDYKLSSINNAAIANSIWVHVICGVTGAVTLYFLSSHIHFENPWRTLHKLDWPDLFLFVIALLGYTGLLPRTLWFFASKGSLNSITKQ